MLARPLLSTFLEELSIARSLPEGGIENSPEWSPPNGGREPGGTAGQYDRRAP